MLHLCNNNVVNIDVVALYLSERLNNNLYYTLEKSIFSVRIYIFLSTLFVSQKKNSLNAATREKKANSLVARFFIFMKILSLVNTYYQRLDFYYYFSIERALQNTLNIVDSPILVFIPIVSGQFEQVLPNLSSFDQSTVSSTMRILVKPKKSERQSQSFV